ncbi:MAG: hypothetical protein AAFN00_16600, partial [Cyanobacteria bacterium J06558_2]
TSSTKGNVARIFFAFSASCSEVNSLNLIVKSGQSSLSKIEQSLAEVELPTFSLAQSRPSLDDVYLAATGQTIMDAEIAGASTRDLKQEKKQQMK